MRTKKVFPTDEVSHLWAKQSQEEARNSAGNLYFYGSKIYSYGKHFCMGNIIKPGIVLFTTRTYSNTTAKHLSHARYAVNHLQTISVAFPEDVDTLDRNLDAWTSSIRGHMETLANPRKKPQTKDAARGYLASIVKDVKAYLEVTGQTLSKKRHKEFLLYFAAAQDEQAAAGLQEKLLKQAKAKERAEKKRQAEVYAKAEKELQAWTKGQGYNWHLYQHLDLPILLRTSKYEHSHGVNMFIETSKGARVSYDAGKLLYARIKAGKPVVGQQIDGYTVMSINGTIKIGCHVIDMKEVNRFAKKEGWTK